MDNLKVTSDKREKYTIYIEVDKNMAPLHKRNSHKIRGVDENQKRIEGAKNVDLWAKGELFPIDPTTNSCPDFKSVTGLVKFLCNGKKGLLGYCENLSGTYKHLEEKVDSLIKTIYDLEYRNYKLVESINQIQNINLVAKDEITSLQQTIFLQNQNIMSILEENKSLGKNVNSLKLEVFALTRSLKAIKQTPLGGRNRIKKITSISSLVSTGGAMKRRVYAIKSLMRTNKTKEIEEGANLSCILKSMFKKDEIISMIGQPRFSSLRKTLVDQVINQIAESMNVEKVQSVCDDTGISRRGYQTLFKCLREGMVQVGITKVVIPRPFHIENARARSNKNIVDLVGDMYHIEAKKEIKKKSAKKNTQTEILILNSKNNIWLDLEKMLQAMVKFYDISVEEAHGKLVFVIKLDEMELINSEKYERVSITLMNRAMDPNIEVTDKKYFSVQSENHIWWLGLFRISKESHETLKWVFYQTSIPTIIASHRMGEKLDVDGYGSYEVEWHLAADLKTLKCMYNVGHGANAKHSCIYCMHTRKKEKLPSGGWSNGITSCRQDLPPNRDEIDKNMDPILPIPLTRVHICTLHAFVRIVDKLVYLSILFVWNKLPHETAQNSIEAIEKVLSNAGLHGGNVKICKDTKLSGARGNVPSKPSMGGVKARHFIADVIPSEKGQWEIYKDLIDAENDRTDNGRSALRKRKVWMALSTLFSLMDKDKFEKGDAMAFTTAVTHFTNEMIGAWGENEITHYMHILYAHAPWFANEYGSLGIWNTQGMEKSHKQARVAYHKNTQHGGGSKPSNPLVQMFEWFYRRIVSKFTQKVDSSSEDSVEEWVRDTHIRQKCETWEQSKGRDACTEWRSKRIRKGKKWVLEEDTGQELL